MGLRLSQLLRQLDCVLLGQLAFGCLLLAELDCLAELLLEPVDILLQLLGQRDGSYWCLVSILGCG